MFILPASLNPIYDEVVAARSGVYSVLPCLFKDGQIHHDANDSDSSAAIWTCTS